MKRTESTVIPEDTQLLQGVLLVNYDVQEEIKVDKDGSEYIMYNYGQSRLQEDATQSDIDKCVINGTGYWVKARLEATLDTLVVTTANGNTFDATLEARANMADAILASETLGITENIWRLADNSEELVDVTELREAHALALHAYATAKSIGA